MTCRSFRRTSFTTMAYALRASLQNAHEAGIWSVAWSSSGQLVTGSCDEHVHTYTLRNATVERKHDFPVHELGVTSVAVSADGALAASSSLDSHIRLMDLQQGEILRTIDAGPIEAWTLAMSADAAETNAEYSVKMRRWLRAAPSCDKAEDVIAHVGDMEDTDTYTCRDIDR